MQSKSNHPTERRNLLNELDSLRDLLDEYQDPEPPVLDRPIPLAKASPSATSNETISTFGETLRAEDIPTLSDAVQLHPEAPEAEATAPTYPEVAELSAFDASDEATYEEPLAVEPSTPAAPLSPAQLQAIIDERVEKALAPLRAELKAQLFSEIMERFPLLLGQDEAE